jgi:transcriptional regulator with XRE-family HTH domain
MKPEGVRMTQFGKYIKGLRTRQRITLRDFCLQHGLDPGNYSRLERGRFPAPQKQEILEKYAIALGLTRGSDEWVEFFDIAAASRGEIPADLLNDEQLMEKLPVLFRTLRGNPVSADTLDKLIEIVRKS